MDASIVYIGDDLPNGKAPEVGTRYELVIAFTVNMKSNIQGVQLRQENGNPAGWIRVRDNALIKDILERGGKCSGVLISRKIFYWDGDECFWGVIRWKVDKDPDAKLKGEDDFSEGALVKKEEVSDGEVLVKVEVSDGEVLVKVEDGSETE
ncbi:hypothetical protein DFP73DRAFT_525844 [Morchella snyderi]|nr:hypothetical protein DFP73DRAFT_525844 [Morchella snyderi]